eukprot:tig00020960_g16603.t1
MANGPTGGKAWPPQHVTAFDLGDPDGGTAEAPAYGAEGHDDAESVSVPEPLAKFASRAGAGWSWPRPPSGRERRPESSIALDAGVVTDSPPDVGIPGSPPGPDVLTFRNFTPALNAPARASRDGRDRNRDPASGPARRASTSRSGSGSRRRKGRAGRRSLRDGLRQWWADVPLKRKQLSVVLFLQALAFCAMVAVFAAVFTTAHTSQLVEQARSEILMNDMVYDIKVNQMGFGYAGQAENADIVEAARRGPADESAAAAEARARAKAALVNEIVRREIDVSSLVTADAKAPVVIVSSFRDRRGEALGPRLAALVARAIQHNKQVRVTALVSKEELAAEGAPISERCPPHALVRIIVTPVYASGDKFKPVGVLVAADVVNGKGAIVQTAMAAFKSGHVAIYQLRTPGCPLNDYSCYSLTVAMGEGDSVFQSSSPIEEAAKGVLVAAARAPVASSKSAAFYEGSSVGATVTGEITARGQDYTVAASCILDEGDNVVAFQVRGMSQARGHEFLRNGIVVCAATGVALFALSAALALWLGGTILEPLRALYEAVEDFWNDESSISSRQTMGRAFSLRAQGRDEIGRLTGAFGRMASRISEAYSRMHESRVKAANEEYRTRLIIETSNDAVFVIGTDCVVISCNHSAVQMFGYTSDELVGQNVNKIMPPEIAAQHDSYVKKRVTSGRTLQSRFAIVQGQRRTGEVFPLELSISEMKIGDEHLFVGMLRDITERKEMERQLERERQRAENLLKNMLPPSIAERLKDMAEREAAKAMRSRRQSKAYGPGSPIVGNAALNSDDELEPLPGAPGPSSRPGLHRGSLDSSSSGLGPRGSLRNIDRQLLEGALTIADRCDNVPVLFADIVNFTPLASSMAPERLVQLLNTIFMEFDGLVERFGLEKIKTIGDAVMIAGGVPPELPGAFQAPESRNSSGSARRMNRARLASGESDLIDARAEPPIVRMARLAIAMQESIARFKGADGQSFRIRIGMHVGTVIAGVIGKRKIMYDLWGDTVNIASRMESSGEPGRTQVSEECFAILKGKFAFEDRGTIFVKGKGELHTYFLLSARGPGAASDRRLPDFSSVLRAPEDQHPMQITVRRASALTVGSEAEEEERGRDAEREGSVIRSLESIGPDLEGVDFTVWRYPPSALPQLVRTMLDRLGLISACKIRTQELSAFIEIALCSYSEKNPFHDAFHAADVMQFVYCCLTTVVRGRGNRSPRSPVLMGAPSSSSSGPSPSAPGSARRSQQPAAAVLRELDHVDMLALLVAALCHDLEHPAVSNAFLVRTRAPMALTYANSSPLERHHAFRCLALLERKDLDIAAGLLPEQRARFTQLVLDTILATDMTLHGEYMTAVRARFAPGEGGHGHGAAEPARSRFSHLDDRTLLLGLLIKCADLANGSRGFENSRHWAERIQLEFFEQGALEAELGLDVTPGFLDNGEPELLNATRQVGFLSAVTVPLFETLAGLVPEVGSEFAANARANVARWREAADALRSKSLLKPS